MASAGRIRGSRGGRLLRVLARPVVALLITDAILLASHLPPVVDGFRRTQFGSFTVDLAWLVGGLVMWWPVLAPNPAISRVSYPWKIGYLFLSTLVPIVPAAFLTYADYPLYALYELAPRINEISAITDQQAAGLIMKAVGRPDHLAGDGDRLLPMAASRGRGGPGGESREKGGSAPRGPIATLARLVLHFTQSISCRFPRSRSAMQFGEPGQFDRQSAALPGLLV